MSVENKNNMNSISEDQLDQVNGGFDTNEWYASQQEAWQKKWEEDAEKREEIERLRREQEIKQREAWLKRANRW